MKLRANGPIKVLKVFRIDHTTNHSLQRPSHRGSLWFVYVVEARINNLLDMANGLREHDLRASRKIHQNIPIERDPPAWHHSHTRGSTRQSDHLLKRHIGQIFACQLLECRAAALDIEHSRFAAGVQIPRFIVPSRYELRETGIAIKQ